MARLVLKFGGTSVADIERIEKAADKVVQEYEAGNEVAVVVSAMSGVTNQLVDYCRSVSPLHDACEYDTVVSSGEQVTAGLMAIAIQKRGVPARSWLGWQLPIICDDIHGKSRILDIPTDEIENRFKKEEVLVLAGFQGITEKQRIATLGRGGSDTSAVALAAALNAERCDIYTDVDGIYTTDPRVVPDARRIEKISYEEMLELASLGAKVLQNRSVEMAMKNNVSLQVLSSFKDEIGSHYPGTLVTKEENIMEKPVVSGIAFSQNEAKISIINVPDTPGVAAKIFEPISAANIIIDMIVQDISEDGKVTTITFVVPQEDGERAHAILNKLDILQDADIRLQNDVAKISVVGIGMRTHAGVAGKMFQTLAEKGINIDVIAASEIKISVLISQEYTELAVRALHKAYNLDQSKV